MPKYQTYGQYDDKTDEFPESAEKVLRAGEESAVMSGADGNSGDDKKSSNEISTASQANKRESLYNAAAGVAMAVGGAKGRSRGGRFMKTRAPFIAIIALIGTMLAGVGFSQVLMPFHVVESLTEMTDGSFTARSARMPKLVRYMFNMEGQTAYTSEIKGLFGGTTKTKYRKSVNSEKTKQRLASEGVEVVDEGGTTVLRYQQADGSMRTVTADDYATVYREDSDFRNKMNRGARSFLGRIAAHIDVTLANFLNSHSLTKNLFEGWINKVYDAEGQTTRLHDVIEARKPATTGNLTDQEAKAKGDGDDNLEVEPERKITTDTDAETLNKNYADMISNIASITTSSVCGAAAVVSAVTAARLVIAYENARGAFSALAESTDKVKAGMGDESPINASADMMIKKDANGLTMLQSEQMKWALSGGNYTPNKEAEDVKLFSTNALMKGDLLGSISTSASLIMGCAVANIATATVSFIANLATLGTFSVGKLAISAGIGIASSVAVAELTKMLVENAKSDFCTEVAGPNSGACVYLGAAKYNGGNFQEGGGSLATRSKADGFYDKYKVALSDEAELIRSEKSPFDMTTSHTFLGSIASKISMLAIDMPNLTGVASTLSNLTTSAFSSLMPAASAAEKAMFFSNQMRDDCDNLKFGSIQAIGDASCEPMYVTDQDVANGLDPEEVFIFLKNQDSFEMNGDSLVKQNAKGKQTDSEDGVEVIRPDSLLGKYISYCAYRSSPFGQIDQNIMNAESQTTESTALSSILNAIPLLGDILQVFESSKQIASMGWSSGANCVARDTSQDTTMDVATVDESGEMASGATTIGLESWDKFMKYAQSYVADDRYMQTSMEGYISPVQLFAEKQGLVAASSELSFVEYLAKYSGYTVENMQIALNELEYWTYIAKYEPEGKGPVVAPEVEESNYDFVVPENLPDEIYLATVPYRVVYADVRNRSVAMA